MEKINFTESQIIYLQDYLNKIYEKNENLYSKNEIVDYSKELIEGTSNDLSKHNQKILKEKEDEINKIFLKKWEKELEEKTTRTEKWKELRDQLEIEKIDAVFENIDEWLYVLDHQKEVKKEIGARH